MSCRDARLIHVLRLASGERVTVRPFCREDGARLQSYVRALSPAARYNRFLGAVSDISAGELARLADADPCDGLGLLAEVDAGGASRIVGEARYAAAPDAGGWEFALSVAEPWRGQGLGSLLAADVECRARELGIRMLLADVLRTNAPMQRLVRKAGFAFVGVPREARLVRAVKDLSGALPGLPIAA